MGLARFRRFGLYVLSFLLGRGGLFAAPLLLANLLPTADYGVLETAQAAASLIGYSAAMGTVGVVPLVLLGHSTKTSLATIAAHHLFMAAMCLAAAALAVAFNTSAVWQLAGLLSAGVLLQSLASTHLKTEGHREASILLDAGLFSLMALAAFGAFLMKTQAIKWVVVVVLGYVAMLTFVYARQVQREWVAGQPLPWRAALAMGFPLMLGGIVSLLATTSGRLGIGMLAGPLIAADYAVLSRAAALPIIAHQLILIARFRNLFTLPHAEVERAAAQIVMLVAASALGFWLLAPWLGALLGPAFIAAWTKHPVPGAWIAAQAILWSAIALNDLVISRHQVMPRILPFSIGFIVLALASGWVLLHLVGVDLAHFVYAHAGVMLLFYGVQSAAMAKNGVQLWRVWRITVGSYLGMIVLVSIFS